MAPLVPLGLPASVLVSRINNVPVVSEVPIVTVPVLAGCKFILPVPDWIVVADVVLVEPKVRVLAPPGEIVPTPGKVKPVAEVVIVSIEATPVKAPPIVTFKPPLDVKAKVLPALPMATAFVPAVPKFKPAGVVVPELIVKAPAVVDQVEAAPAVKVKAAPLVDILKTPPPVRSFIVKLLPAKLIEVLASTVMASLNSVKLRESLAGVLAFQAMPTVGIVESTVKTQSLVPPNGNLAGALLAV